MFYLDNQNRGHNQNSKSATKTEKSGTGHGFNPIWPDSSN